MVMIYSPFPKFSVAMSEVDRRYRSNKKALPTRNLFDVDSSKNRYELTTLGSSDEDGAGHPLVLGMVE